MARSLKTMLNYAPARYLLDISFTPTSGQSIASHKLQDLLELVASFGVPEQAGPLPAPRDRLLDNGSVTQTSFAKTGFVRVEKMRAVVSKPNIKHNCQSV